MMDSFICGYCQEVFHELVTFLDHKSAALCGQSVVAASETPLMVSEELPVLQAAVTATNSETTTYVIIQSDDTRAKKRGRPRKTVQLSNTCLDLHKELINVFPSTDANDVSLTCDRCKKTFSKSRQFLSHKCISLTEVVDDDGDVEPVTDSSDWLPDSREANVEYNRFNNGRESKTIPVSVNNGNAATLSSRVNMLPVNTGSLKSAATASHIPTADDRRPVTNIDKATRHKFPLFTNENDRIAFEGCLNVNIESLVAGMYSFREVPQNVNKTDGQVTGTLSTGASSSSANVTCASRRRPLTIYTCNTCKKSFTSLSHVHLHCLVHTDLRPFRCLWCKYSANTRGNLYTHVRRHTGSLFHCPTCEFTSVNKTHLLEHLETHSDQRHTCEICRQDYNTRKSLVNHVRKYHARTAVGAQYLARLQNRKPKQVDRDAAVSLPRCDVCGLLFRKPSDRDRHLSVSHGSTLSPTASSRLIKCDLCDELCSRQEFADRHMSRHRVVYVCCVCGLRFPSVSLLSIHLDENHTNPPDNVSTSENLILRSIDISFFLPEPDGSLDGLAADSVSVEITGDGNYVATGNSRPENVRGLETVFSHSTEEDGFRKNVFRQLGYRPMNRRIFEHLRQVFGSEECSHCGKLFSSMKLRDVHSLVHTGEKAYACNQCSRTLATLESLHAHIARQHRSEQQPQPSSSGASYVCDECSVSVTSRQQLLAHRRTSHNVQPEYLCTACNLTFTGLKRLRVHLQMKHGELSRSEINRQLASLRRHHGKIGRRYQNCPYCGLAFPPGNSSSLRRHVWIHEGVKPFRCAQCSYACRSSSNLAMHQLRHSTDRRFLCKTCGRAYKSRTAARWHERSHTGVQLKCDRCPYVASQPSHLHRHTETHNLTRRYVCNLCDYSANTASYLKIHKTRKHPPDFMADRAPPGVAVGSTFCSHPDSSVAPESAFQVNPCSSGYHNIGSQSASSLLSTDGATSIHTKATLGRDGCLGQEVFPCPSCDYRFGNQSEWKRHLRTRHNVDVTNLGRGNLDLVVGDGEQVCAADGTGMILMVDDSGCGLPGLVLAACASETGSSSVGW